MKSLKRHPSQAVAFGEGFEPSRAVKLVVPPERALLPVEVTVTHQSYEHAASEVRRVRAEIEGLLGPHTLLRTHDYTPPTSGDGTTYRAWIALEVEVDLRGLSEADQRMDRLDAVLGRLLSEIHSEAPLRKKWTPKTSAAPNHGALHFDLYAPQEHRPALLAQVASLLEGLPEASPAAQWDPSALTCVSTGEVRVCSRRLGGVTLELDLSFALRSLPSAGNA